LALVVLGVCILLQVQTVLIRYLAQSPLLVVVEEAVSKTQTLTVSLVALAVAEAT
jgi:hypothetical protein